MSFKPRYLFLMILLQEVSFFQISRPWHLHQ
uniref:Uncharacterized protein n=1 Tax=Rhizophora mucronata TaxID=61149 RepID=A0A2P2J0G6_RHIMU